MVIRDWLKSHAKPQRRKGERNEEQARSMFKNEPLEGLAMHDPGIVGTNDG
jgi:hypothetical protein